MRYSCLFIYWNFHYPLVVLIVYLEYVFDPPLICLWHAIWRTLSRFPRMFSMWGEFPCEFACTRHAQAAFRLQLHSSCSSRLPSEAALVLLKQPSVWSCTRLAQAAFRLKLHSSCLSSLQSEAALGMIKQPSVWSFTIHAKAAFRLKMHSSCSSRLKLKALKTSWSRVAAND